MSNITVLTSSTCSYCVAAKNLLQQNNIEYQEIDLMQGGEQAQELLAKSGQRTVPQIFIDAKPIGGFTELAQLFSQQEFDINQLQTL